jgi:hypothetical protein
MAVERKKNEDDGIVDRNALIFADKESEIFLSSHIYKALHDV